MFLRPPVQLLVLLVLLSFVAGAPGCVTPTKFQEGKPFVFSTNINIQSNLSPSEKADLKTRLENQLDDSIRTLPVTVFPGFKKLRHPPVFDTVAAAHSVVFMYSLLQSLGYYKAVIKWDSSITRIKGQQRVNVSFAVTPGKSYHFDSIIYRLEDPALQQLIKDKHVSLIKKGNPYSVELIANETDRLVELFRNNGYFKITREDLLVERDTVFAALINPSLDPFEQLRLLQEARKRQENPLMNLVFKLRNPQATNRFRKYYIRNVQIFPDLDFLEDSMKLKYDTAAVNNIKILSRYNKFRNDFIASKTSLRPAALYRLFNYNRTYNNFTELNTFTQVSIDLVEAKDSAALLDVIIKLYPTKKQSLGITADASYNTGDVIATGNLFGVGLNLGLANRNVGKQAIQTSTNLRTGIEIGLDSNFIQTFQTSLSHTISFPKFIVPFKIHNLDSLRSAHTLLNFNAAYTARKDFYLIRSLNASWGYQWTRKRHVWYYSPLNIEYVQLTPEKKLDSLFIQVPELRFSFNTGLVISQLLSYNYTQSDRTGVRNYVRVGIEESGALFGLFKKMDQNANLYRFIKADLDFRHYINFKKSALAFRAYGGIGVPYGKNKDGTVEVQLPFFKSFYAGGPYSMRGWQVRQLGIGSSKYFDTAQQAHGVDRFGDIQLEGNMEYRFNLGVLFGIKLKSALFADVGNIWYRNTQNNPDYAHTDFNFGRLYQDIAVAAGTSFRLDFDYFLIRLDWAYKLKDPAHADINKGWGHDLQLKRGQIQLGISYPF
jgi:outer membrane protein assembly factor BamA